MAKRRTEPTSTDAIDTDAIDTATLDSQEDTQEAPLEAVEELLSAETSVDLQEENTPSESTETDADNAGATPATESTPEQATGPATAAPAKPTPSVSQVANRNAFATLPDAPFKLPSTDTMFPGYPEAAAAEMARLVGVQVIENFKGCITLQFPFECKRGQQFMVAKWFALQYQDKLVIKE